MIKIRTPLFLVALAATPAVAQEGGQKAAVLFGKPDAAIARLDRELNGVMGTAILDFTSGRQMLRNADEVFPTASTIKIAVPAEPYHQSQQADLMDDSRIMAGLSPCINRVTNRDLATFMVVISDNSATNVLIDRLGMTNVNALLDSLGLQRTRLRRKMIPDHA